MWHESITGSGGPCCPGQFEFLLENLTMFRRRALAFAAVAAASVAFCFAAEGKEKHYTVYYYMITASDGTMELTRMPSDEASDMKREIKPNYKEAIKDWKEERQAWYKAVGKKAFPLPPPKQKKIQKLAKMPSTEKKRDRLLEKYQRRLEIWDVCLVKNHAGERSAEAIRHDKVLAKRIELLKEYIAAEIEWVEQHKDAKERGDDAPVMPSVTVVNGSLKSSELADKYAEKLAEKLEKEAEKEEAD